jgi:hypothetical protein
MSPPANGRAVSCLRLITWNCRSGSVAQRMLDLAEFNPDLVFLQECGAIEGTDSTSIVCSRTINKRKNIVLLARPSSCRCVGRRLTPGSGRAAVVAQVVSPIPFLLIGIWGQGPRYVEDVLLTLRAQAKRLKTQPSVVLGDMNSGSRLGNRAGPTKHHRRLLDLCAELGLTSAYHAFHQVEPGAEADPTYFHQYNASLPWHIDFCFVPLAWAPNLMNVAVVSDERWVKRSDHRPLLVEIGTSC